MIVGTQVLALGLCAHAYGTYFMGEQDPWFDRMRARFRLEHGLLLGGAFTLVGAGDGSGDRGDLDLARVRLALRRTPRGDRRLAGDRRHPDLLLVVPAVDPRSAPPLGVRPLRRIAAVVFAGDARVWRAAALVVAVPLVALVAFYCVRPRDYYTGTNNVEAYTYVAETPAGEPVCVPGLHIPGGTARIRLQLISRTRVRPALKMALTLDGSRRTRSQSGLARSRSPPTASAARSSPSRCSLAQPAERAGSLCLTAADVVNWGGTPLPTAPSPAPPTMGGRPLAGRIAVWYLPARRSSRAATWLARRHDPAPRLALPPGLVGPWLYVLILLVVLPGLALASVRCLALAADAGRRRIRARRLAVWLFAIAALNFACWALITPPFQAPDEVDHFAYTQSLVERGHAPSRDPGSPLPRWSSAESLALEDMSFFTDHQVGRYAACRGCRCRSATTGPRWPRCTRAPPTAAATRRPRRTARSTTRRWPRPTWPRARRPSRS